jgi:16S rRNA (adenine1518-N6/adenine1519-N6)-dimethyltransferase
MDRRGLGVRALRELAARHGVRPKKSLGQHFLVDPNLARSIVRDAGVRRGDRVLEVGAGLGSLTLALAETGAGVLAIEIDRPTAGALRESVRSHPNVRVLVGDALRVDWSTVLEEGPWKRVSNLPYNVAVPLVLELLRRVPQIGELTVMVQREAGERLAAGPGHEQYGAVSVRVTYHAQARTLRRVPRTVFWPEPNVESVVVRLIRRPPPVSMAADELFGVVDEGFAQRRKTMRNALTRLGLDRRRAERLLGQCGLDANIRAEQLGIEQFACLAEGLHA